MKKLIIFDLDGTLMDTSMDLSNAFNYALKQFGYEEKSVDYIKSILGNGVSNSLATMIPQGKTNPHYNEMLQLFNSYYENNYLNKTIPYEGMIATINALKEKGYLLAVCTNKKHEFALNIVGKYFQNSFDVIQGKIDNLPLKPNPDSVKLIQNRLNIKDDECIYVGDTEVDLLTANNSHIDCLLVTYGFRKKSDLEKIHNKSCMVDSPCEILDIIK